MQYEITLPADYDMGIIRKRVADRGHLTDAFPGLALKAYLVRERAADASWPKAHSTVNQYAPFYLWRTSEGMNSFLWGPGFRGLSADFGRPPVRHWLGAG